MKAAVLLATYNGSRYIEEQLNSLLAQTCSEFVCYIHDDGSSDRTLEICNRYATNYPEKFCLLNYPPTGSASMNFLSLLAYVDAADYYLFCDQDDIWLPEKFEKTMETMRKSEQENPGIPIVVFTDQKIVDAELNVLSNSFLNYTNKNYGKLSLKTLLIEGFIPGCAMMINSSLRSLMLKCDDFNMIYMHDWWAMEVALACGGKTVFLNEPLMLYRQHDSNCIGVKKRTIVDKAYNQIKQFTGGELSVKKKMHIRHGRELAKELLRLNEVTDSNRKIVQEYVEIEKKNKLSRMAYYAKNYEHTLGLLLWV
mgnify:CR=1 FL=1